MSRNQSIELHILLLVGPYEMRRHVDCRVSSKMTWLGLIELVAVAGFMVLLSIRSFNLWKSFSSTPASAKSLLYIGFGWIFLISLAFRYW